MTPAAFRRKLVLVAACIGLLPAAPVPSAAQDRYPERLIKIIVPFPAGSQIGPLNQVVHLWRYDNLADMEKKRTARDADPAWGAYLSLTEGLVLAQEDKVMRPASFSPMR
jgi:hypothetical protein